MPSWVEGIRGRWSKAKLLGEAGSSSSLFLAGSEGFRLLGPEFQLYQQPVILFKQTLLFKVAGLAGAVTTSIAIVTGLGGKGIGKQ